MVKSKLLQSGDMIKRLLPLAIGLGFMGLLWTRTQDLDWFAVQQAFEAIPHWRWAAALLASVISFWAVAQYDVIAHRHFGTAMPARAARHAGAAAIAVGQTTGFGPVIGAAIRWRLMPALGHAQIARVTGFVTLGFLSAWALLSATIALPLLIGQSWLAFLLFPIAALGFGGVLLCYPELRLFGFKLNLPSLRAMSQMTLLAGCDLIFAGLALHLLLPPEIAPSLPILVAAFALALGAGMMGGTPGGVGPFELALLALIPSSDVAGLAAALIAFRLVYYVIPCIAGLAYAALGRVEAPDLDIVQPLVQQGPRAEHAIARQSRTQGLREKTAEAELLETPQSLALFLGPSRGQISDLLTSLRRHAFTQNRHACLYKITAQDAVHTRNAGWTTAAIAQEAVIDTRSYSTTGPERRQLRRFLRKASKAKVVFAPIEAPDWPSLHAIHKEWEEQHGQERGLSMGRFCPLYLRDKPLFGAYQNGVLIGFTSGLSAPGVLSLDLMRHRSDIPNGTMHGLINHMITWAQEREIDEVCLAAIPHPNLTKNLRLPPGLTRFKASFAPRWRPLYMAAPNRMALIICALDIMRTVLRPPAIPYTTAERWQVDALITGETAPVPPQTKLRETG